MSKSTGIPGVLADDDGDLQVVSDTAEAATDIKTGIPGVTADNAGALRVTVDNADAVKVPTGIPGVLADSARRLRVTEGGTNVIKTGIPGVFADGLGNLRVTNTGTLVLPTGIPNVFSDAGRLRVTGLSVFSPADIAGLKLWLKADAITGLVDTDPVTTWPDSSGLGNDAGQATAAFKPTYQTNELNGKPVVRFDGTDDELETITITTFPIKRGSIFIVVNNITPSATNQAMLATYNGADPDWEWSSASLNGYIWYDGVGGLALDSGVDVAAGWNFLSLIRAANTTLGFWLNGTAKAGATIADNQPVSNPVVIGGLSLVATEHFNGDIAEVIIYDSALSTEDREAVEAYLATKYGL